MICIIMGVSGSGKTTIGQKLGDHLGWSFYDADDFHPPANLAKMSQGIPLEDSDRQPWLMALNNLINHHYQQQKNAIIACSSLKASYRKILQNTNEEILWIYLKGDFQQILERVQHREGHFMKAEMLSSQFQALEEPNDALVIDISLPSNEIVGKILSALNRPTDD